MKYTALIVLAIAAVTAGFIVGATPAQTANIYTVNSTYGGPIPPATNPPATDGNTSDNICDTGNEDIGFTGVCTLRAAIEQANSPTSLGLDTIAFDIDPITDPGYDSVTRTFRIQPASALPVIGDPVIIDGRTQDEFAGEAGTDCTDSDDDDQDLVVNDGCPQVGSTAESGAECANDLNDDSLDDTVVNDGCPKVFGQDTPVIELSGFSAGSLVDGLHITAGNSTVRGLVINKFGITDGSDGIELQGGGNNVIEGNFIGVDVNGIVTDPDNFVSGDEFGNNGSGVFINGSANNTIGGTWPSPGISCFGATNPCNLISGQHQDTALTAHGVEISGTGATGNVVKGNFIGVDFGGPESGRICREGSAPEFPGPVRDDDNDDWVNDGCPQVGGAPESGLGCQGAGDNDSDGFINDGCPAVFGTKKDIGNEGDGVNITGVTDNTIGGGAAGDGNVISGNDASGVRIFGGPEAGTACTNPSDNDGDNVINDGCPQAGAMPESGLQCANGTNDDSADDTLVNDGCPEAKVARDNHLEGNLIGPGSTGDSKPGAPPIFGVIVEGAPGNFIGAAGGARNVVSGNADGIQIEGAGATGNLVQNNYVGTDVTGAFDLGNAFSGVVIEGGASSNTVGGTGAAEGNVLSGNDRHGMEINGGATANMVQGNYIGTNAAGAAELPNGITIGTSSGRGIKISGAPGNTIGGSAAARNVISGNIWYGIEIVGTAATGNIVQGNNIGTNPAGTAPIGNRESGIYVDGAPNTVIGGTIPNQRNIISGNGYAPPVFVAAPGIVIIGAGATGTLVQGNFVGTDATGSAALANLGIGVLIIGAPNNTLGGTSGTTAGGPCTGACNVISGNGIHGVEIDTAGGTGNLVLGNFIGLNVAGSAGLGNAGDGVFISEAPANTVGGTAAGSVNVISANGQAGVHILNLGASANLVQGNYIGTDASGALDRGNTQHGVWIDGAPDNIIGGTVAAARNIISGNNATGITIQGGGASGNLVRGNRIGTDAGGTSALGNTSDGTRISGNASGNTVGGAASAAANTIAHNGAGIVIDSGTGNSVLSNSIHTNGALGINLGIDGLTANDSGDGDTGANNLQNFPVVSSATVYLAKTTVSGTLNSLANQPFQLQFFGNAACDAPSGHGEGATYLGTISVTTVGSDATFTNVDLPTGHGGNGANFMQITATATDQNGNTSELSACRSATISNDQDADLVLDASDNCPFVANGPNQASVPGVGNQTNSDVPPDTAGDACDLDDDNDKVTDIDEQACGGNRTNAAVRPERVDGSFLGVSDDGDAQVDEPLPPGSQDFDCDGDGFKGTTETHVTTSDQDPCGSNGWPADLPGASANNKLDIQDLASFVAPTRRLNTSPGDTGYSARWDLVPAATVGEHINATDMSALVSGPTAYPPMFAPVPPATGGRAFGQTCPWP